MRTVTLLQVFLEELVYLNLCFATTGCFGWLFFFFSSRRRHTRSTRDWSSDVCSSDLWKRPGPRFASSDIQPGWQDFRTPGGSRRCDEWIGYEIVALRRGARDGQRLLHPVHGRDLRRCRWGFRRALRGHGYSRAQGHAAPAPRRRRGGAGRLGGQVAVRAPPPCHGRVYGGRGVRYRSLLGLGLAGVLRHYMGRCLRRGEHHVRPAHTIRSRPRAIRRARAPGHDPGGFRNLGHPLRREPCHLRGRSGAYHRRSLDHQLRGWGWALLRRFPGLRHRTLTLRGRGWTRRSWPPRGRGRGYRGRAGAPRAEDALLRRDG